MFFAISAFYMLVKAEADLWKIMFLIDASLQFHANMHILLSSETKYGCNPHTANLHMLTGKQMESIKGQKCKKKKKMAVELHYYSDPWRVCLHLPIYY